MRARLLGAEEGLLSYPWRTLMWYLAAAEHRPCWVWVDRLLGEHGIRAGMAAGRKEFEERMEGRRREEVEDTQWNSVRRG